MGILNKATGRIPSKTLSAIIAGTWKGNQNRLHDGGGLYIRPNEHGGGYWLFRFMVDGRERNIGMGSTLTAAEARSRAQGYRDQLRRGEDPLAAMQAVEARAKAVAIEQAALSMTFDDAAADWIDGQIKAGKHTQTLANFHRWRAECQPILGAMSVREIKPSHVAAIVTPIYTERFETGKRMLNWIRNVIDLGLGDDDQTPNPASKGKMQKHIGHFKKGAAKNREALPWQKVPELVAKLWAWDGGSSPRANALLAVILSGLRAVEVTRTEWTEFDIAERCWTKPAEHMKMRREHFIPISSGLASIFDRMRPMREGKLVFPGLKAGEMIDENGMLKLLRDLGYSEATVHGFRSSISDWGGAAIGDKHERRYGEAAMKRVLAHGKNGEGVIGRYHRDNYYHARVEIMEAWAAHCLSLIPAEARSHLKLAA